MREGDIMRMLLYQPGEAPVERDVAADQDQLTELLGTSQYEWMTVRFLQICVIHDADGKAAGKKLNRLLGKTPLYGDFLVCGIAWDDDGVTDAVALTNQQVNLVKNVIFDRIPDEDHLDLSLPSYARKKAAESDGENG